MIKKIVCAICAAAMMILVCGCGNNSADKGDGVPTLVWYVPGDSQRDTAAVMEAVNKLIEPKIGAKLDLKMIDEGAFSEIGRASCRERV